MSEQLYLFQRTEPRLPRKTVNNVTMDKGKTHARVMECNENDLEARPLWELVGGAMDVIPRHLIDDIIGEQLATLPTADSVSTQELVQALDDVREALHDAADCYSMVQSLEVVAAERERAYASDEDRASRFGKSLIRLSLQGTQYIPGFQMSETGDVIPAVAVLNDKLSAHERPWEAVYWWHLPRAALGGLSPIAFLELFPAEAETTFRCLTI